MVALDSSILIAALRETEKYHEHCLALLAGRRNAAWVHALSETFSTLTGGSGESRLSAKMAARSIELSVIPQVQLVVLPGDEYLAALQAGHEAGVRGGAIYDFLHLRAARKVRAKTLFTLNVNDFRALRRDGDPAILHPTDAP